MAYAFLCAGIGFWNISHGPEHLNEWVCWTSWLVTGFVFAFLSTQSWEELGKTLKEQEIDSRPVLLLGLQSLEFFISLFLLVATMFLGNAWGITAMGALVFVEFLQVQSVYRKHRETFIKLGKVKEQKSDQDTD
jgi:hypothetical protein